jgi:hypothetical protein
MQARSSEGPWRPIRSGLFHPDQRCRHCAPAASVLRPLEDSRLGASPHAEVSIFCSYTSILMRFSRRNDANYLALCPQRDHPSIWGQTVLSSPFLRFLMTLGMSRISSARLLTGVGREDGQLGRTPKRNRNFTTFYILVNCITKTVRIRPRLKPQVG